MVHPKVTQYKSTLSTISTFSSSEKTWEESWSWFLPILAWLAIQVLFFIGLFIEGVRRVTRGDNPDAVFVYNATIGLGNF